ncbi:protein STRICTOSIDINE SYNTHASE-LIKE 2-like [Salvia miltiorrhiza]|uniref:protein STRICTOSIDINE SYNTHASE-LIKE 2-like n=1 Tax=Salvia miltiorrhiza TaxID=226208 RepID=UPI0025AC1AFA|nr:protein STRICTOSIDINE SYNTHASE-LIKE 2-like [Salvia miltiorrhiza]
MQPQYFYKIMTTPIVFQAKAMTTNLIISTAFLALVVSILLLYFDAISIQDSNIHQEFKNDTSLVPNKIHDAVVLPMPGGAVGPESFTFDSRGGGPYTGVSDGRIIRWQANESRWVDFAVTSPKRDGCVGGGDQSEMEHICGRPLGLCFNVKTGGLYIADAYMGLVYVGPNGGLSRPIVKEVNGIGLGFTNSVDVDQSTGVVYFTDSSTRFQRRKFVSAIISGDDTGRLMKFDPRTRKASVLVNNLKFPNGVALSRSGDFLLFVETTTCKLYKLWLTPARYGEVEVVTEFFGFPDNIKRNRNGEFWVGINSRRGKLLQCLISQPWIGNAVVRFVPWDVTRLRSYWAGLVGRNGMGVRLDRNGNVVEVLDFHRWKEVSEVHEEEGSLWIGSVVMPFSITHKFPNSI